MGLHPPFELSIVLFMVHIPPYNKAIKESTTVLKGDHIMKRTVQNILLTVFGAALIWGGGWLFLTITGAISQMIN